MDDILGWKEEVGSFMNGLFKKIDTKPIPKVK